MKLRRRHRIAASDNEREHFIENRSPPEPSKVVFFLRMIDVLLSDCF